MSNQKTPSKNTGELDIKPNLFSHILNIKTETRETNPQKECSNMFLDTSPKTPKSDSIIASPKSNLNIIDNVIIESKPKVEKMSRKQAFALKVEKIKSPSLNSIKPIRMTLRSKKAKEDPSQSTLKIKNSEKREGLSNDNTEISYSKETPKKNTKGSTNAILAEWASQKKLSIGKKFILINEKSKKRTSLVPGSLKAKLENIKRKDNHISKSHKNVVFQKKLGLSKPSKPKFTLDSSLFDKKIKPEQFYVENNLSDSYTYVPDTRPLYSTNDYIQLESECFANWKAEKKDSDFSRKKQNQHLIAFIKGSLRDKTKAIILSFLDLVEEIPTIVAIYQQRSSLETTKAPTAEVDTALTSYWKWLKVKCALLATNTIELAESVTFTQNSFDKKSFLGTHKTHLDSTAMADKGKIIQIEINDIIKTLFEKGRILWINIKKSIECLVLCHIDISFLSSVELDDETINETLVYVLLDLYQLLTINYRSYIKATLENLFSKLPFKQQKLFCEELKRRSLLFDVFLSIQSYNWTNTLSTPGFNTLANVDDLIGNYILELNSAFTINNTEWIISSPEALLSKSAQNIQNHICNILFQYCEGRNIGFKNIPWKNYVKAWIGLLGHAEIEPLELGLSLCTRLSRRAITDDDSKICMILAILIMARSQPKYFDLVREMLAGMYNTKSRIYFSVFAVFSNLKKADDIDKFIRNAVNMNITFPRKKIYTLCDWMDTKSAWYSRLYQKAPNFIFDTNVTLQPLESSSVYTAALYLIQSGNIYQTKLDILAWIKHILENVKTQDLPILFKLMRQYAITETKPIPENLVMETIYDRIPFVDDNQSDNISLFDSKYMLLLYYLLHYNNTYHNSSSNPKNDNFVENRANTKTVRYSYSDKLIDSIPGKLIVGHLEKISNLNDEKYKQPYIECIPEFFSLLTTQYQYQMDPGEALYQEIKNLNPTTNHQTKSVKYSKEIINEDIKAIFLSKNVLESQNYPKIIQFIEDYMNLPTNVLFLTAKSFIEYSFSTILKLAGSFSDNHLKNIFLDYPKPEGDLHKDTKEKYYDIDKFHLSDSEVNVMPSKTSNTEKKIISLFCQAWYKLYSINASLTITTSVNSWNPDPLTRNLTKKTIQDLWVNPTLLFQCSKYIFIYPELASLFLTVLNSITKMSKSKYQKLYQFQLRKTPNINFKPVHFSAFLQLQDVTIIHMLFEILYILRKSHFASTLQDERIDVSEKIYAFIHQKFLEQHILLKLVHFEGYECCLIKDIVQNVPSTHTCFEFLPELVNRSNDKQAIFAVELATCLFQNYPMQKSETIAKDIVITRIANLLKPFVSGVYSKRNVIMINSFITALIKISITFPKVSTNCISTLTSVQKECGFMAVKFGFDGSSKISKSIEASDLDAKKNSNSTSKSPAEDASWNCTLLFERIENAIALLILNKTNSTGFEGNKKHFGKVLKDANKTMDVESWEEKNKHHSVLFKKQYSEEYNQAKVSKLLNKLAPMYSNPQENQNKPPNTSQNTLKGNSYYGGVPLPINQHMTNRVYQNEQVQMRTIPEGISQNIGQQYNGSQEYSSTNNFNKQVIGGQMGSVNRQNTDFTYNENQLNRDRRAYPQDTLNYSINKYDNKGKHYSKKTDYDNIPSSKTSLDTSYSFKHNKQNSQGQGRKRGYSEIEKDNSKPYDKNDSYQGREFSEDGFSGGSVNQADYDRNVQRDGNDDYNRSGSHFKPNSDSYQSGNRSTKNYSSSGYSDGNSYNDKKGSSEYYRESGDHQSSKSKNKSHKSRHNRSQKHSSNQGSR
ncbi:hypothetical protein BB559_003653 [Furculomyces boomerangus]|uniref:Uncharacterized protein n=2 Tax=Harpellales TaxID=61421 RepID=A0A2T9YJU1_9FUNG|nr:hypothetical protein BB559_003653 [Furculomyces boomerangus]PWA02600.1 hypothetical protein BB558_001260 [Smittium angustum]